MSRIINGAFGLAIRKDGKLLLTKRHQPQHPAVHHKWQVPGGGQEFGEHLEDTLKREMMEELGVSCTILDERPVVGFSVWNHKGEEETQVNLFTYLVDIGNQEPRIVDAETADFAWYTPEEVEQLDTLPNVKEFVRAAVAVYTQR